MSSFTYVSKAVVAATTIGSAGEVVHHIRRLSSSSSSSEEEEEARLQWSPFENEFEFRVIAFVAGIVTLVLGVLIVHLLFLCVKRHHNNPQTTFQPATRRISPVSSLEPVLTFTNGLTLVGETNRPECRICLSNQSVEGGEVRILSHCRHGFHLKCLETWLLSSPRSACPTCRSSRMETSVYQNPPEQQQHVQPNDDDLEAANLPEIEMVVLQQQQQNDSHEEAANLPEPEIVIVHQQQLQRTDV